MKFMLLKTYSPAELCDTPITEWTHDEIKAHMEFLHALNAQLVASGELVDAHGLAGPDEARIVVSDGRAAPIVTDGPFPETKEFLAGYYVVEVDSLDRALEIAALASQGPGPGGAPIGERIEVRQVISAPDIDA